MALQVCHAQAIDGVLVPLGFTGWRLRYRISDLPRGPPVDHRLESALLNNLGLFLFLFDLLELLALVASLDYVLFVERLIALDGRDVLWHGSLRGESLRGFVDVGFECATICLVFGLFDLPLLELAILGG